jgi:uncharacterized protein DUF3592
VRCYIAHVSILHIIPKQSRLFWIQSTEIKTPTGILNESDGGIYITAQLLADAEIWYGPKVFYSYSVDGESYENLTLSFKQDSHTQSKEYAESIVAKYPPGGAVTVSYRPNSPSNSTIETGLGGGSRH